MTRYTIEVSETIYNLLNQQATAQDSSLEQVLEALLSHTPVALPEESGPLVLSPAEGVEEALAAVERLTALFADVQIRDLEDVVDDPLLELANIDLTTELV